MNPNSNNSQLEVFSKTVVSGHSNTAGVNLPTPLIDFDGNGKTDVSVYNKVSGWWFIRPSGGAPYGVGWGVEPRVTFQSPQTFLKFIERE